MRTRTSALSHRMLRSPKDATEHEKDPKMVDRPICWCNGPSLCATSKTTCFLWLGV